MSARTAGHSLLFLSCDLTGSTNYKQRADKQTTWRKTFLQFYREFPQTLATMQVDDGTEDLEFELWKPVGDELIFTCLVRKETDVFRAVRTWTKTMREFEVNSLDAEGLGTKGGAFIATFPGPDSESSIPRNPREEDSDKDVVELNREALKGQRSLRKYLFDYFGPSIDTGFRVLSRCSSRFFTLSIEVAYAMTCASVSPSREQERYTLDDLTLIDTVQLKGVWGGRDYPLFAIDLDHTDSVLEALRPFKANSVTTHEKMALCTACYRHEDWPFKLYLPEGSNSEFKDPPVDPLADYVSTTTDGAEEVPDEADGVPLPDDAPLG
ncbi:hypothetical protein [Cellulosimicrobium aquatile]|uniref:hypothetical protein n=1 Tax=Cellulosimicrobium aquatile TaxID=1612203 RepID=UPI0014597FE2|nr:hypothetical protein [Cellulosimicrobium aquatile]NMF27970.1 hypothetical protein [Cellulosimicrobium aquatile]